MKMVLDKVVRDIKDWDPKFTHLLIDVEGGVFVDDLDRCVLCDGIWHGFTHNAIGHDITSEEPVAISREDWLKAKKINEYIDHYIRQASEYLYSFDDIDVLIAHYNRMRQNKLEEIADIDKKIEALEYTQSLNIKESCSAK